VRGWAWLSVANRRASTLTIVAIFALGSYLHGPGNASVGTIVSFVGLALALIGRLEQFSSFLSGMFLQAPGLADFFGVLDTAPAIRAVAGAPPLGPMRGEVAFEGVNFSHGAGPTALRDLSVTVPAGATVALVGPTGAGKTTALALLYRRTTPRPAGSRSTASTSAASTSIHCAPRSRSVSASACRSPARCSRMPRS
jgi:ABC-type multidrug transport system fused ATPase/permease subunit